MRMYERLKALEEMADSVRNILGTSTESFYEVTFYGEDDGSKEVGVKIRFSEPREYSTSELADVLMKARADSARPLFKGFGERTWNGVELLFCEERPRGREVVPDQGP